ncbi:MAG: SusC/RagA family TonB-linked outer membrane protein [Sphingobacterium sp.]|jgi:TonB-linked SusC/RagA family outer membrane protein|uniref:SusC/RagA family TonB-linked outer membrane protein n=1 Tax=Sphingobacterium sp. TaxID=341027 RepID=UPI00284B01FD|nr:SusC/RagA family TonB-linked outer membrane protein [Sphingobacterium sp.]MDR3008160.1 SusC/RagA family TonB-linked outer membrane protein [Sphingobacterium sp.]
MNIKYFNHVRFYLTLLLLTAFFTDFSVAAHAQKITLKTHESNLKTVIKKLEDQISFRFLYADDMLKNTSPVTLSVKDKNLRDVLTDIFQAQPLSFQIEDKTIIIKNKMQQLGSVSGTIRRIDDNAPMSGVTIKIVGKGLDLLTVSDPKGNYTFADIPYGTYQLSYSYIGYLTTASMIHLNALKLNQDMTMRIADARLDQVVVIGYGAKQQKDLTSSVSSINQEKLADFSNNAATFESILGGAAKGVMVTQNSGAPGSTAKLNIRGITSPLSGSTNEPLYVIDGVPFFIDGYSDFPTINPLSNIPVSEIESIDILKDAAATAIYGSRGANGVIIVKTNRGKKNRPFSISADYTHSINNPTRMYKPLSFEQFKDAQNTIILNTINGINEGKIDPYEAYYNQIPAIEQMAFVSPLADDGFGTPLQYRYDGLNNDAFGPGNTDWTKVIRNKNARTSQFNLSLNGGSDNSNLAFNFNTFDQEGLYINNGLKRYSGRLSFDSNITERLTAGASLSYAYSTLKYGQQLYAEGNTKPWLVRPDVEPYDANGNFNRIDGSLMYGAPVLLSSPLAQLSNRGLNNIHQFLGAAYAEYEVLRNFKLRGDISVASYNGGASIFAPTYTQDDFTAFGSNLYATLNTNTSNNSNTSLNFRADYNWKKNGHQLYTMAGIGFDRSKNSGDSNSYEEFPDNEILTDPGSAARNTFFTYYRADQGLNSIYSRLSYKYKDRYLAEANFRTDESSKFGPGNKRAYFPSLSIGWRINNEQFMETADWINDLKLRLSWGNTGSTNINNFLYRQFFVRGSSDLWGGKPAIVLDPNVPNRDVKWEKTREYNTGLDFALFGNRFTGSFDLYDRYTTGALAPAPIALEAGSSTYSANIIDMSNKGFEIELGYDLIKKQDFTWNLSFNIARNRNKIEHLNGANINAYSLDSYIEGYPAGTRRGYLVEKIFDSQEEIDVLNSNSPTGYYQNMATGIGDYKYKDLNGDGVVTTDDREVIATAQPKYFGGFYNRLHYKNFNFSFVFQYSQGASAIMEDFQTSLFGMLGQSLQQEIYGDMWSATNPDAHFAKITYYDPASNSRTSDRLVYETSFLRLKNINLSYTLPTTLTKKWRVNQVSVFASASNLWTLTKWPGLDPEFVGTYITTSTSSNDAYPMSKTFSMGIKAAF